MTNKKKEITIHSSAADYLIYVASTAGQIVKDYTI